MEAVSGEAVVFLVEVGQAGHVSMVHAAVEKVRSQEIVFEARGEHQGFFGAVEIGANAAFQERQALTVGSYGDLVEHAGLARVAHIEFFERLGGVIFQLVEPQAGVVGQANAVELDWEVFHATEDVPKAFVLRIALVKLGGNLDTFAEGNAIRVVQA